MRKRLLIKAVLDRLIGSQFQSKAMTNLINKYVLKKATTVALLPDTRVKLRIPNQQIQSEPQVDLFPVLPITKAGRIYRYVDQKVTNCTVPPPHAWGEFVFAGLLDIFLVWDCETFLYLHILAPEAHRPRRIRMLTVNRMIYWPGRVIGAKHSGRSPWIALSSVNNALIDKPSQLTVEYHLPSSEYGKW